MATHLTLPLQLLRHHPDNPRRGDVARIMDSLRAHGQYKPLVVVQDTEATTYTVLAGNHTLDALTRLAEQRGEAEPTAACWVIDVDDTQAKKIMLADNRTSDHSDYNSPILADLLIELDDLQGTGWTDQDLTQLLEGTQDSDLSALDVDEPDPNPYSNFVTVTLKIPPPLNDQWQHWCRAFDSPEEALEYLLDHGTH